MAKLHVFVNKEGEVIATGPAPDETAGRKGEEGPVFVGFSPANGTDCTAFELEIADELKLSRRNSNIDEFHSRIGEMIRTRKDLRQVAFMK